MIEADPQYNVAFDSQRFSYLMSQKWTAGFEERLGVETAYIDRQLKTDLGERLDVEKSTYTFEIRERRLYEPGRSEPFEDVMRRGIGRRSVDLPREYAEIAGFRGTIQAFIADPDTPEGSLVVDISPRGLPGSNYQKNYFDVHMKVGGLDLATRYFSNLSNETYREKIIELNSHYSTLLPENPTDIDFKSNPLIVPDHLGYSDPDQLARFILKKRVGIAEEELNQIWIDIAPITTSYINYLAEAPEDLYTLDAMRRAIYTAAARSSRGEESPKLSISREEILYLAEQSAAMGGGGCGGSGACSIGSSSVGEALGLEPDTHGDRAFNCPDCGALNIRWVKNQLLSNCQQCKSDKVMPANLRLASFQPGISKTQ